MTRRQSELLAENDLRTREKPDDYLADWQIREEKAEAILVMANNLYRQKSIRIFIYGRPLHGRSPIEIMKSHRRFARSNKTSSASLKLTIC